MAANLIFFIVKDDIFSKKNLLFQTLIIFAFSLHLTFEKHFCSQAYTVIYD